MTYIYFAPFRTVTGVQLVRVERDATKPVEVLELAADWSAPRIWIASEAHAPRPH